MLGYQLLLKFIIKLIRSFFLKKEANLFLYNSLQLDFIFWYCASWILDKPSKIFDRVFASPALEVNPKLFSLIKELVSPEINAIIGVPVAKYVWNLAGTVLENNGLSLRDKYRKSDLSKNPKRFFESTES